MAITDTFALVFETQGSQAVVKEFKRVQDASDAAANSAQKAEKGFTGLKNGIVKALAPLAAFGVIVNRTLNFAQQGEGLLFMANSAGVAAEKFSALALAAERIGGSRAGMAASLGSLTSSLMGIRRGEENGLTQAAMYYGVRFGGPEGLATPEQMLENIARAMQGRSAAEQMDMGRMLGLDDGTIRLLQRGVEGLRKEMELAQKYNPFDEKTLERIQKFQYSLRELKAAFTMVAGQFLRDLIPHFQRWAEIGKGAFDYLISHADEVKLAVAAIGLAILKAFGPLYLLGGLLVLLVDDFATFARGGESALKPLWEIISKIVDGIKTMSEWLKEKKENPVAEGARSAGNSVLQTAKSILNPAGFLMDQYHNTLPRLLDNIRSADWGHGLRTMTATSAMGGGAVFNNQIEINVNESGDPQKTMQAVGSGLTRAGITDAEDALLTAQVN
ncbi:MAG: hypothetical protein ACI37O_02545 [Candidatus Avelusimicrobium sp.]|uniref:hypothetical protein n=1 Tax=Candidatus Avelusimicrobium sp. TaxID=3048833 RepID=UPI003F0B3C5F